jgi:hypothetical protein
MSLDLTLTVILGIVVIYQSRHATLTGGTANFLRVVDLAALLLEAIMVVVD